MCAFYDTFVVISRPTISYKPSNPIISIIPTSQTWLLLTNVFNYELYLKECASNSPSSTGDKERASPFDMS